MVQTTIGASYCGRLADSGRETMRYDEQAGKVFCLVEAPDAETAVRVHREAHRLVADRAEAARCYLTD